ncbi:histidine triad nucleotide-binding protein [bacterium]|nr:histidine triad nucleotide-binding protein [bacterium]MBT3581340.1 histidine triad nucleotide-binding protein [bacterium]MBT4552073.1 histidine triad nucleotide-binding protein [bacterium]MBT5989134.1 histidine triad nucleotide-binding protein [bacterium]MBT7088177.1 histidine triad nucleotide-binding protein [bacterium]
MSCIFCEIVAGKIPCDKVYEDANILAFKDIAPQAPVHVLVISKKHLSNVLELDEILAGKMMQVLKKIALDLDLEKMGFRIVNNTGEKAGQSVEHLHFHILGGREFNWPPG